MTRSGPNNNRPPRGPRFRQWLTNTTSAAWDILRAKPYADLRRESERIIRQKMEDKKRFNDLMEKNLEQEMVSYLQIYVENKLSKIIEDFKAEDLEIARDNLNELIDYQTKEINIKLEDTKKEIFNNADEVIHQQFVNLKVYKNVEFELRKVQAAIILIPIFLVAFSVFFKGRIDDIMSIDALQTEIKHLQEDVRALQPNREHGARQPWEEPPLPPWGKEP